MDSHRPLLIPLADVTAADEPIVGGKAAKLGQLARAGFNVPPGFCLTTWAYEAFVSEQKITAAIQMELGRKSLDEMRWEEIWDAALRIRSTFLAEPLSAQLAETIASGLAGLEAPVAVRSSAIGEDSADRSFAGLHESAVGVCGNEAVEHAVRIVWASLWSDAALLYRTELGLDPARSRMAVLIQAMVDADRSGVAFARDPRDLDKNHAMIESVPGPCRLLVDGLIDPDRWEINRDTRRVITWRPGRRDDSDDAPPLLSASDLECVLDSLLAVERLLQWSPDMEWTGRSTAFTVLQARPITTAKPDADTQRAWYLTLRPGDARLKTLRRRVADELIPRLTAEGDSLAAEPLEHYDDHELANAIEKRVATVTAWKKIYWDEFIPFAHGVRRLATYYNDAVQPEDPYEFVGLLRDQPLLAARRNSAIKELAGELAADDELREAIDGLLNVHRGSLAGPLFREELRRSADGAAGFIAAFDDLCERFLDIAYDGERLHDQVEALLSNLMQLSRSGTHAQGKTNEAVSAADLEDRLLRAVGSDRHAEALDVIETGRVSWKLRDDDNLLVARLESQLLRGLEVAACRLRASGQLSGDGRPDPSHAAALISRLREPSPEALKIETPTQPELETTPAAIAGESPRQLIGQPASPGIATASVRCIRGRDDLGKFQPGEVLVCDAIQPTMTHLVLLASAVVERRGGMLIHGAIIARELGIPCVNGVHAAADILQDGDLVTVDGHLGIVTVGAAEFDLEFQAGVA